MGDGEAPEEELQEKIEEASEVVEEATEEVASGAPGAEARLEQAERRLEALEQVLAELRSGIESRAPVEHNHPLPGGVQTISDALSEIEAEETSPERKGWWYRKMGGGRD